MTVPLDNAPLANDSDFAEAGLFGLPVPDPASAALIRDPVELAASDFLAELRLGLKPSLEVYLQRHPQYAERLREMLPLVAAMESWKMRQELGGSRVEQPSSMPFARLGDCRLVREIGRGGMGVVFEAVREPSGQRVAVKLLSGRFPEASFWRKRFYGEAQTVAGLRHHHIIPVYNLGEQNGWCYFSMQLIEGLGLDRIIRLLQEPPGEISAEDIRRRFDPQAARGDVPEENFTETETAQGGSLGEVAAEAEAEAAPGSTRVLRRDSWWQVAKIGMQVAAALRYAHGQGIIHRDIKPANLLLDANGSVWVADFGLASNKRVLRKRGENQVLGTLRYISPEQLYGAGDERSDVYSLGVTLYELCTLQPAFDADDKDDLLKQVCRARPRKPRSVNRRVPVELERIILKAMSSDLTRRYQSAADLLEALRPLVRNKPGGWFDPFGRLFARGG